MTIRISRKDLMKKVQYFQAHNVPYRMEYTNERTVVHAERGGRTESWMNRESSFRASELHFIRSVKDYIVKNGTFKHVRNNFKKEGSTKKIKYFYYNKRMRPGETFENIVEIDIKGAYWYQAFKLKLFDEALYQKGLTVSKKSRLAAIGSLARTKNVIEFDGKTEKDLPPMRSTETEFLWNVISYRIGKIMARAAKMAGNDFMFFWVDAIFLKNNSASKKVLKMFKKEGFTCNVFECEWAKIENNKISVKCSRKPKPITRKEETEVEIEGRKFIRVKKTREWRDIRPFPFVNGLSESDVMELADAN